METTTRKRIIAGLAAVAMCGAMVPSAMAANTGTVTGSPTNDKGNQICTASSSGTCTWTYGDNVATDKTGDGSIDLVATTSGWTDPDNPDSPTHHDADTYQVIIPTKIAWTGLSAGVAYSDSGTNDTSTKYDVTVRGDIPDNNTVVLTNNAGDSTKLTATGDSKGFTTVITKGTGTSPNALTTAGTWTHDEAAKLNDSGNTKGTTVQDTIAIKGTPTVSGDYTGTVKYTATLASAN